MRKADVAGRRAKAANEQVEGADCSLVAASQRSIPHGAGPEGVARTAAKLLDDLSRPGPDTIRSTEQRP
jgi:hypothetical protein